MKKKMIGIFVIMLFITTTLPIVSSIDNNIKSRGSQIIDLEIVNVKSSFGKITADIQNTGTADALNVEWSISVKGGLLHMVDVETTDVVPVIVVGETFPIETDKLIIGFGKADISIKATYVDSHGTCFLFGPFLLNVQTAMVPVVTPWKFSSFEGFPCTIVVKCNEWAVAIEFVTWTKNGNIILLEEIDPPKAAGPGETIELEEMNPPEEPNDFEIVYKAVKGGTVDDVLDPTTPDQYPFYVSHHIFEWNKPYPTNPE